jgi:hypothetical protein
MDGATLAVLLIIAYFVVSPDRVSLSLTRGSTGAARKAVGRRWSARSGNRGGKAKRRGTTFRQAVRQAWADGREAAAAAKARREAGRDTYSQLKRAGRAGGAALGVAHATGGTLRERVRAGWRAGATHWRDMQGRRAASTSADSHMGSTDTAVMSPSGPGADSAAHTTADQTSPVRADTTDPTDTTVLTGNTNSTTPDKTTDTEGNNAMDMTELESLEAVRREARQAMEMSESLTEVVTSIKDWATGLADRWSGTEWGTADLNHAVAGVGDAAGTLTSGEALTEALVAIEDAVKRAEALGEVATEIGAHGDVDAFRAA